MTEKKGRGRPTKFTKETTEALIEHISNGVPVEIAVTLAGIKSRTYYDYKARGEADEKAGIESEYSQFSQAVKKARGEAIARAVVKIQEAGIQGKSWQALAWFLERTCPEIFALRSPVNVQASEERRSGEVTKRLVIEASEIREVVEILRDANILEEVLRQKPYGVLADQAGTIIIEGKSSGGGDAQHRQLGNAVQ